MKLNKYLQKLFIIATTAFLLTACNGIDNTRNNDNDVTNTRYPENVNENPYKYVTNKNRMYFASKK
jgi:starvation-inducible outer membrane lipoprotein